MSCCQWYRGENDSLFDSDTKAFFCGTCWQKWLEHNCNNHNKSLAVTTDQLQNHNSSCSTNVHVPALVTNDETLQPLQMKDHTDGKQYLCSESRRLVFLPNMTADEKLQCVGEIIGSNADTIKLFNVERVALSDVFPFPTAPEDHCETPFEAYNDLAPYLSYLAKLLGKDKTTLKIWDPYYCDGAVKRNFSRLGFTSVHNEREDFYVNIRNGKLPDYDCIVTNPPYSTEHTDHIHRLVKFLCAQDRPWFVVQPNFVYVKQYWNNLTASELKAPRPFFLTPATPRKYKYKTPAGVRHVQSAQQLKTSPFVSFWYCWTGPRYTEKIYKWIVGQRHQDKLNLSLACTEYFLPDSFKDSNDKTRRKKKTSRKRPKGKIGSVTSLRKANPISKKRKENPN